MLYTQLIIWMHNLQMLEMFYLWSLLFSSKPQSIHFHLGIFKLNNPFLVQIIKCKCDRRVQSGIGGFLKIPALAP